MKILITGKNGQLGWELSRALAPFGEVIALGRDALDLAMPDQIISAVRSVRPEVLVNAAAYTAVDRAESEPEIAHSINTSAAGLLAEEAKRARALLIHYSTDYVFDGAKSTPYLEDDVPNPLNVYGRTKLGGEQAVQAVGGSYLILRTSWIYAARGRNFFLTIRRLLREKDELRVVADQIGAPTSARALADATADLLQRHGIAGLGDARDVYHATASGHTSWHGFASEIARLERVETARVVPITSSDYPTPARRPANSRLSNDKLQKRLGASLPTWRDCLEACYAVTKQGGTVDAGADYRR